LRAQKSCQKMEKVTKKQGAIKKSGFDTG
jgi:hypothetical protein